MLRASTLIAGGFLAALTTFTIPALAQVQDDSQVTTQGTKGAQPTVQGSNKMSGETTGTVSKSGEAPKAGMNARCKDVLANQAAHTVDEIRDCGGKSE